MKLSKALLLAPLLTYATTACADAGQVRDMGGADAALMKLSKVLLDPVAPFAVAGVEEAVTMGDTAASAAKAQPAIVDYSFGKPGSNSIEVGFSHDSLTKGRGVWNGGHLNLEHRFAPRTVIYSNIQQTSKFGLDDTQFMLGGYYPINSVTLNVEGTYSGTHHVIAEDSIMGSLQFPLGAGWLITGGLKHSDYTLGPSTQEFGVLEWYYKNYRTALTVTDTQSLGENLFGERLSFSRYYNDISFVSISLGNGREVDRSVGKKVFLDTKFVGINGRHWFNPDWAMIWSLTEGREGNAYNHTGVSLGLRYNF